MSAQPTASWKAGGQPRPSRTLLPKPVSRRQWGRIQSSEVGKQHLTRLGNAAPSTIGSAAPDSQDRAGRGIILALR
jgi:hypothetical protein